MNTNAKVSKERLNIIPYNFAHHINGGYAEIYYNSNIGQILKLQPLFEESKHLCTSTLYETILYRSLLHIPELCQIDKITINNGYMYHYMPYYGKPLHEYISDIKANNTYTKQMVASLILEIINALIKQCILLNERGIQHTDLKPSNILINETTKHLTIIDFNICSTRTSGKTQYGWSFGIGTWCFCSPEIVYNEEPSDTSMVWTIGLLIAYLYTGHRLLKTHMVKCTTRDGWMKIFNSLKTTSIMGLPLSKEDKTTIPPRLQYIYTLCTLWDWQKRPSLYELYSIVDKILKNDTTDIMSPKTLSYNINGFKKYTSGDILIKPYHNNDLREKAFQNVWNICKKTKRMDLLCKSLVLIDKFPNEPNGINIKNIIGCVYISYILSGSLLSDNAFNIKVYNCFDLEITMEDMNTTILHTIRDFNWDCYFETADTLIIDLIVDNILVNNKSSYKNNVNFYKIKYIMQVYTMYEFYKILYNIIKSMTSEYTMQSITELLFKEIFAQKLIEL